MGLLAWHARNRQQRADLPANIVHALTFISSGDITIGQLARILQMANYWRGTVPFGILYLTLYRLEQEGKITKIKNKDTWVYRVTLPEPQKV